MGDLLSSSTGADFLWLLGGVALVAVAALDAARRSSRTPLVVVGVAAAAAMLIRAIGGHAAAAATPALQIGLQWIHFMAASVWMGGLALAFLALRARRRAEEDAPTAEIRRYSSLAGYALAVVLVTGVLRATEEVGGLSTLLHLFRGSYDTTLDIKVAVVIALIGLGALNRYRSIPRMASHTGLLRRVMAIELVGAVGVFGLTGTLTGLPPRPPRHAPGPGTFERHAPRQRLRHDHEGRDGRLARHRGAERVRGRRHRFRLRHPSGRHRCLAPVRARGATGRRRQHAGADAPRRPLDGERQPGVDRGGMDDHGGRPDRVVGHRDPDDAPDVPPRPARDRLDGPPGNRTSTPSPSRTASRSRCTTTRERRERTSCT